MYHLESSYTGKNGLWRYVVMLGAVLIASNLIGGIPLFISMFIRSVSDPGIIDKLSENPNDIGALGLDPEFGFFAMLFPFIIGLLAFALLVKPLNHRTFGVTINGRGPFRWNRFFISALVYGLLSAAYLLIYLKVDPTNFRLNNASSSIIWIILLALALIPFQAAFEEVLFRAYLMQGFTVLAGNRWVPLLLSSLFFGLMHSFNPEIDEFGFFTMMPQYVLFGLIFGVITVLDDGIEAAIGAHAANNAFLCIMVTNRASALQTPAVYEQINIYPWLEFAGLLVTGVIFLVILKVIFNWGPFSVVFSKADPAQKNDQIPYKDVLSSVR